MSQTMSVTIPGALGTNAGADNDGVLFGQLTAADPTKAILEANAEVGLCITKDDATFVDETTPWGEATADDVEILPATPAVDDACYFGHATGKFGTVSMDITTAHADMILTLVWEYWDGSAYVATLSETDNTTGFTAATGDRTVVFTPPTDWARNTVFGVFGYWIRARVSAFTSITTAPQVGSGHVILDEPNYTDDTTDFTDDGAADVILLPAIPTVGDSFAIGYTEKFCKAKVTTSTARTGTATLVVKYWDGSSITAITKIDDDTVGWSTTAGTLLINFVPPTDWVANTAANGPNGQAGFFIWMELTALTSVTANPVATQGWVYPLKTGASGIKAAAAFSTFKLTMNAQTKSGTTEDSEFLVINTTSGAYANITWTKADPFVEDTASLIVAKNDEIAIVQVGEDGTTEFADANLVLTLN